MTEVPDGYLGTDGRIDAGPAPELIDAGYALEIADAPLLHDGLSVADLAHVLTLAEQQLMPAEAAGELLGVLLDVAEIPADAFPYDVRLGDAYNSREKELVRRAGDTAGWVHFGRTRREAGRIAFRLAIREQLLDLTDAAVRLLAALSARAETEADSVFADTTYLQPAQPSTFGHYLASFGEETARHLQRLRAAYQWVDISPGGSGGVAGTRLDLNRQALADRVGLGAVGRNTRDTMWNVDGLIDLVGAAVQCALTADRLAEDLEIMTSPGFGWVRLDGSLTRASVLMPQKRNPYALAVIRSGASTLTGRLAGVTMTARSPSARTDNWLHAYSEVSGSLRLATRVVNLAALTVESLQVDRERLAASASDVQVAATDVADELCLRCGVDYRSAYRVVGRAVAIALAEDRPLDSALLADAATAVGVHLPGLDQLDIAAIVDPRQIVASRREVGSCAPDQVRAEAATLAGAADEAGHWAAQSRAAALAARTALFQAARTAHAAHTDRG